MSWKNKHVLLLFILLLDSVFSIPLCGNGAKQTTISNSIACIYEHISLPKSTVKPLCEFISHEYRIGFKWDLSKDTQYRCPPSAHQVSTLTHGYCLWEQLPIQTSKYRVIPRCDLLTRGVLGYVLEPRDENLKCAVDIDPETATDRFRAEMHHEIRKMVIDTLISRTKQTDALLYVAGSTYVGTTGADNKQEPNFMYLTGVWDPGYQVLIDIKTRETILFAPVMTVDDLVWNYERIPTREELKAKYGVDKVFYTTNFTKIATELNRAVFYKLNYQQLPSNFTHRNVNSSVLASLFNDLRAVKTAKEVRMIREASRVSSHAHIQVSKALKSDIMEYQLQSVFTHEGLLCGLKRQSYDPIIGSGVRSAVLHYIANDKRIEKHSLLLIDAGMDYFGYATDITRTWPTDGKFTDDQKTIYNIVLASQQAAIKTLKEGVSWSDVVAASETAMLEGLKQANFVKGDIQAMRRASVQKLFQPHGLGHLVGLKVHDSYVFPTILKAGMVLTIEPGVYFPGNGILFDNATPVQKQYLVMDKINQFRKFGGVRIEDTILVTKTGSECLSNVPKTIEEIEKLMAKRDV